MTITAQRSPLKDGPCKVYGLILKGLHGLTLEVFHPLKKDELLAT